MTTLILDTGLLAEASLSEGANWVAAQQFTPAQGVCEGGIEALNALETSSKSVACFMFLDRFSRLGQADIASTDALSAMRAGFQEHTLCSDSNVEWHAIMGNLLYLLQRGQTFVLSEAHIDEISSDVARAGGRASREAVIAHLHAVRDSSAERIAHLFDGFRRAA